MNIAVKMKKILTSIYARSINALNNGTSNTYDLAGNLSSVTDALNHTTSYTYDLAGNRTSMTDAKGNVTSYHYGAFNLLMSETDAANRVTTYRYNLDGKLTKMVDRRGNTTNYSYDARGHLTEASVLLKNETTVLPENQITYQYDSAGNRTAMSDISGEYTYDYDILNRLTTVSKAGTVELSYTYTAENSIASVSYGGKTTNYTYDMDNRLKSVRNSGSGADYFYDQGGNVTKIQYLGGVQELMTYNKNNAVLNMTNKNAAGDIISNTDYEYDSCGRLSLKYSNSGGGIMEYVYDAVGRISRTSDVWWRDSSFTYDELGNIVSVTADYNYWNGSATLPYKFDSGSSAVVEYDVKEITYTYSERNELLSAEEEYKNDSNFVAKRVTDYSYDENGNQYMTVSGLVHPANSGGERLNQNYGNSTTSTYFSATQSTFDGFNRLKDFTKIENTGSVSTSYVYNGDGLRKQKTETNLISAESKTTNYVYDGQHVVQENGDSTATYVRGLSYIAKIGASNSVNYYLYNAHGDVTHMVDSTGKEKSSYDYNVFGEKTSSWEGTENSIQYAGEFYDSSAGLYYLRARYYNPSTGRFISEDSYKGDVKDPASLNLYTYCKNDPVNNVDPTGHVTQEQQHLINMAEHAWKGGYISYDDYAANVRRNGGTPVARKRAPASSVSSGVRNIMYASGAPSQTVLGFSKLSGKQQSSINSAYRDMQGKFISFEEYMENVKLNGGTLAEIEPNSGSGVTFEANNIKVSVDNYAKLSDTQQISSMSTIDAYSGGYINAEEAIYSLKKLGADLSGEYVNASEAAVDTSYNGTGFSSFLEFYTYTLVEPEEAEMILYRLNDTNQAYLDQTVNDYVYHQGGVKRGNNNIFQVIYSCPPGGSGTDNSRYEDAYGYYQYVSSDRNIYDNYTFTLFDALNWMIQTGGTGNFVLQTRVTRDPSEAAAGQRHIVGKFMDASNFMRRAKVIGEEVTPQLYIGSTEHDALTAEKIYLDIMSTPWLKGSEDIIGGIYFGNEDGDLKENMETVSMFIHGEKNSKGEQKKLIWIPYVSKNRPIQTIIDEYAYETISGLTETNKVVPEGTPLFDFIIVQPGTYYNGKDKYEEFVGAIKDYYKNPKTVVARVGFEMEFDMGVVTGRKRTNDQFTPLEKRRFLNQYLSMFDKLQGMGIPVGVYSGGPNEQGYGNILGNHNTHNSGNHVAYWEGIDETAYAYGVPYDQFPSAYVGGNAIYDINNYLYNGIWNPALTESLWLDPR